MEPFDTDLARDRLEAAVSETFADMAFLDAEPRPGIFPSAPGQGEEARKTVRAAIDVLRPASCRIELRMSESLRARIFEILSAGEEEGTSGLQGRRTTDAVREDVVLELLNVIAGSFLTSYYGPGSEIKLELPRYFYLDESEGDLPVCDLAFDVEKEELEVALSSVRYRY